MLFHLQQVAVEGDVYAANHLPKGFIFWHDNGCPVLTEAGWAKFRQLGSKDMNTRLTKHMHG